MNYKSLGLKITNKCNMSCLHCIAESTYSSEDVLSKKQIKEYIEAGKGLFSNICLTGGEALLYFDLSKYALLLAQNYGFTTSIVSNCYWVRSDEKYKEVLGMLNEVGLNKLAISFDEYHDSCIFGLNDLEKILGDVSRRFDIVVQSCYLDESITNEEKEIVKLCNKYNCVYDRSIIIPFGRARDVVKREDKVYKFGNSCNVLTMPMVGPDGVFMACCGPSNKSSGSSPLNGGKMNRMNVIKCSNDLILNALNVYGPYYLYKMLTIDMKKRLQQTNCLNSMCEMCRAICEDNEAVEYLYEKLEKDKWIILCSANML